MTEGYEIHKLLRVALAVTTDTGLVFSGCRCDGRNIGFIVEGTDPDAKEISTVTFNLDLNRLLVDTDDVTMQQERALRGIAAWLDINFVELQDLEEEAA
jgi:hypothetical protein